MEFIKTILTDVLTSLYTQFLISVVLTCLGMVAFLYIKKFGMTTLLKELKDNLRGNIEFRRYVCLLFYCSMILCRTVFFRRLWSNPVSNVFGVWGIYNPAGDIYTDNIENCLLFIPFSALLLWVMRSKNRVAENGIVLIWTSIKFSFCFSLGIELLQLMLRYGSFQLSDIFYNTFGGLIGAVIYWLGSSISRGKRKYKMKKEHKP